MTPNATPPTPEPASPGRLRATALTALAVGATGAFAFFLRAGQHTPRPLLLLMAIWVLSPFVVLTLASMIAKRWPIPVQATLYGVMLVVALGTLAIYGDDAMGHRRPQAAFVYVLVPPVSWLLTAIAVGIAALVSRKAMS